MRRRKSGIHPFKRSDIEYDRPNPIHASKQAISQYAERIASKLKFKPETDLEDLINSLGGELHYLDPEKLEATEDGSILVHGEGDFEIFLSNYTGILRDRFTIAHELGHYFLHSRQGEIAIQVERNGSDRLEWEANWFAAAFLMPADQVKSKFKKYQSLSVTATYFQVSIAAMQVRLETLGLL
ncbi:ImmA/IrrE family metallo-endopeptidase [Leptospira dzoumogneensis]|uniref:ImmA/IrrE family metallo-endopeptidase n=1 Tax=Leptospira dzoumogneensis TaxID=2484904 RepID=A0A4Z1AH60_9LEPT|nr:ImmA/IrrE family metallo-endopeptidase [Leptospira dzoumogneensis]TGM97308.1 ImmA/IrrE family metallo-endopeptidase [Leptospira dzoumogneensis]